MSQLKGKEEIVSLKVSDQTTMEAYVAHPNNPNHRAMIVVQEAFGVNDYIKDVTRRFAALGYLAIAPEVFHRSAPAGFTGSYTDFPAVMPHMQAMTLEGLEADLGAAYDFLKKNSAAVADGIGCVGFCMGGRAAFVANSILPLKWAISFYGAGIGPSPMGPGLLERVPKLSAPTLFFWGGKDGHILPEQTQAVTQALRKAGKSFVNAEFSDAEHGFFCDARPSYHPKAAPQAWALVQSFLQNAA